MLRHANIHSSHSYKDYEHFLTFSETEHITELGRRLKGKRILHINATDTGGGVTEVLSALVSFEQSLNISSSWRVLTVKKPFFWVTKKLHNALQGSRGELDTQEITDGEWQFYLEQSKDIAYALSVLRADLLVIHDPQPLMAGCLAETNAKKAARIHIDLSNPDARALSLVLACMKKFDRLIFSLPTYVPADMPEERIVIIPPSIDPLSDKNKPMKRNDARRALKRFGIGEDTPLIVQVSRFDAWKDPIGVIHAHQEARKTIPELKLLLLGSAQVEDDPEAAGILRELQAYTEKDPSIIIVSEHSNELVNAVQTAADVVLQKSIREGFGLTAAEAMWKYRPVVAGDVGGLKLQIENGETGFLVRSPEEAAEKIVVLLKDAGLRRRIGEKAHESVRERFLLPREAHNHLQMYADVLGV